MRMHGHVCYSVLMSNTMGEKTYSSSTPRRIYYLENAVTLPFLVLYNEHMSFFICSNCGEGSASWMGRCPNCSEWNTLVQKREAKTTKSKKTEVFESKAFEKIAALDTNRNKTDVYELDRVLGGGVVKGEV